MCCARTPIVRRFSRGMQTPCVWRGRSRADNEPVIIIKRSLRAIDELRALAAVGRRQHPNIVQLLRAFEEDGRSWLVFEQCRGSLGDIIDGRRRTYLHICLHSGVYESVHRACVGSCAQVPVPPARTFRGCFAK